MRASPLCKKKPGGRLDPENLGSEYFHAKTNPLGTYESEFIMLGQTFSDTKYWRIAEPLVVQKRLDAEDESSQGRK